MSSQLEALRSQVCEHTRACAQYCTCQWSSARVELSSDVTRNAQQQLCSCRMQMHGYFCMPSTTPPPSPPSPPSMPQAADTQRLLAMAEGRLAHADTRARDGDAESVALRTQLSATSSSLNMVAAERDQLREELRAVSEDLEALVRENQVGH